MDGGKVGGWNGIRSDAVRPLFEFSQIQVMIETSTHCCLIFEAFWYSAEWSESCFHYNIYNWNEGCIFSYAKNFTIS